MENENKGGRKGRSGPRFLYAQTAITSVQRTNPGQLGGVVVQFGESYCTKKKKPRLLKRWHNMLRVPDWCKNASVRAWCASMILPARKAGSCTKISASLGRRSPRHPDTLQVWRQIWTHMFQRQARTPPLRTLNVHLGLHQVVEVFDGVSSLQDTGRLCPDPDV